MLHYLATTTRSALSTVHEDWHHRFRKCRRRARHALGAKRTSDCIRLARSAERRHETAGCERRSERPRGDAAGSCNLRRDLIFRKKIVHGLAEEIGFDAHDAGGIKQARVLEPFSLLWITLAFQQGWGREFAFKVLRR